MAGLLGDFEDPQRQGLLALGLGLLNSRGNFGQGLGQAGMQAMDVMRQAKLDQQRKAQLDQTSKLQAAQLMHYTQQAEVDRQKALRMQQTQGWAERLMGGSAAPAVETTRPSMMPGSGARTPDQNAQVQRQATAPRQSMLSSLNEDQIAGLVASGALPKEVIDIWKTAKFGQQINAGSYRQGTSGQMDYIGDPTKGFNVSNGQVSLMPGAVESQAAIAGATAAATTAAQEAARAPYTLVDSYQGGVPGKVPLSSVVSPPRPSARPVVSTSAQQSANADALKMMQAELTGMPEGQDKEALKRTIQRLQSTGSPTGVPGNAASAPAGFFQTAPSQGEKAAATATDDVNKSWLKSSYEPALSAGSAARDAISAVRTARFALSDLGDTGFGTGAKQAAARVLGALGVPNAEDFAANGAIFQKAAGDRLFTLLGEQKGPQTEGDAERGRQLFASITIPKQANLFILDSIEAKAEWDQRRAKYFQEALPFARERGDLQEVDRRWQRIAPSVFDLPSMQKWKARLK